MENNALSPHALPIRNLARRPVVGGKRLGKMDKRKCIILNVKLRVIKLIREYAQFLLLYHFCAQTNVHFGDRPVTKNYKRS